jgi:serine/threonine protein kinase
VYRWVDGHDLQSKLGQLPAALVTDIGMKLAVALRLLHKHRINHRDIRPKNVVLSHASKDPVLIDFGLAKFNETPAGTRVSNEFTAPEVSTVEPRWTSAADIFGLGATLRALLTPAAPHEAGLLELIAKMMATAATERPDASELVAEFDRLRARFLVEEQLKEAIKGIDELTCGDRERRWYIAVVDKFKPTFRMLALGLHSDMFDRCAEIADFLNQILEAYPAKRGGRQLTLGYVKNDNDDTGERFKFMAIESLHQLRLLLSHGDPLKSKSSMMRKLSQPTDDQLRTWAVEGAEAIGEYLEVSSLPRLIEHVLRERLPAM